MNEMLDAATTYCCKEHGFKEITLSFYLYDFDLTDQLKFDEYLLQTMIEKTKNLE